MNLQDSFLNQARTQKVPVNIYLMNGFQIKGTITGFDNFIILLDTSGKQSLVFKHAVSTISPMKPIQIFRDDKGEPEPAPENKE